MSTVIYYTFLMMLGTVVVAFFIAFLIKFITYALNSLENFSLAREIKKHRKRILRFAKIREKNSNN